MKISKRGPRAGPIGFSSNLTTSNPMPARYLLDTNIVFDLIRNPQGRVFEKILAIGESLVCIDVIIAREICFRLAKRASPRLTAQANQVLGALEHLPLAPPTQKPYAEIRLALEKDYRPIGPNDLWIAAHARACGMILVTDDFQESSRVRGLKAENWLLKS